MNPHPMDASRPICSGSKVWFSYYEVWWRGPFSCPGEQGKDLQAVQTERHRIPLQCLPTAKPSPGLASRLLGEAARKQRPARRNKSAREPSSVLLVTSNRGGGF